MFFRIGQPDCLTADLGVTDGLIKPDESLNSCPFS